MPKPQSTRTFIAALVGVLITRIVAAVPVIAAALGYVDGIFAEAGFAGISALAIVQAAATAGVILAYQRVAQWLGDRWPDIERWMLGSAARPHYEPRYAK